ncbi:KH domain protein [Pseudohyphozyma bogoriensis]|nr:KH domain protein [Pseudohyphozyma bogoriensis]
MDIYTTSFCLPRNPLTHDLTPASSFDYGTRDAQSQAPTNGAAAGASNGVSTAGASAPSTANASSTTQGSPADSSHSFPPSTTTSQTSATSGAPANRSSTSSLATDVSGTTTGTTGSAGTATSVGSRGSLDLNDAMHRLCVDAMAQHQCLVSFTPMESTVPAAASPSGGAQQQAQAGQGASANGQNGQAAGQAGQQQQPQEKGKIFNFHLSGGYQQVMSARGSLLRDNPFKRKSVVKVPRAEVLDGKENVKAEMRRKLDEIASLTKAHLAIVGQVSGTIGFGLETERNVEIVITGPYESVEQARVRLLVLLDELSGLHSEVCEIDYKLHNIISGRKRQVVQTIQEETGTNIYFPTPLSGVLGSKNLSLLAKQNLIFITGEFFGVQRARDMLFQVSLHKSKCIISRDTAILPRKLDWILTDRLEEIKQIMNDNGTFINFPAIGSQASLISVYGDHRVHIERTIRAIMQLACQFYVASFWLLPVSFDVFMPPPTINPAQVPPVLRHIAATSGAEAVFKSNCFELHGLESEVRAAVQLVLELDFVKAFHHEIRFQIELANEHREFISGKKNGKLNKIMKSANVKIKFETFNDYNFLIDVAGSDTGALHGLTMLQEELPAEISFHVPEAYHKRIIGVGGKNIQRIMKKYGVYVKFSNAEEFAALGGYTDNEDNVVARTPAKNAINLEHLKQSVMELVSPKDKDFVVETVSIPRRYHRTLLGEKSIFIHDIEAKTNSAVRFPNKETASDIVAIFGPESQVHIAAQMLLDHVPFEAEYRLPHSAEMAALTLSQDFVNLTERIKRDLNITILPWVDRTGAGEETIIRFCLNRSNVDFLATSRDLVEEYLVSRNINLYPGSLRPRSDSFADAFPFFNSKLLSNMSAESELRQEPRSDRKLRLAASSPNIKALFDANPTASYGYRMPEQEYPGFYPPPHQQLHQQLPPPHSPYTNQYQVPPPLPQQGEYQQWGAPRQMPYPTAPGYPSTNSVPFPTGLAHVSRLSHDETALKRVAEEGRKPRTLTNRAQSLDLSHAHRRDREQITHEESVEEVSDVLGQLGIH